MRIRAFQGLVPVSEHASEVACVPYDVVDAAEAASLAAGRPRSLLHVDRAEIDLPPGTDPYSAAVYAKARENFLALQRDGGLSARTGPMSKEPGADFSVAGRTPTRSCCGASAAAPFRRLSIPRDTVANIPGHGLAKINDGFAVGGPALAIKTIEQFTGLQINHVIMSTWGRFRRSSTRSAGST